MDLRHALIDELPDCIFDAEEGQICRQCGHGGFSNSSREVIYRKHALNGAHISRRPHGHALRLKAVDHLLGAQGPEQPISNV
jgi:hypothetical protein